MNIGTIDVVDVSDPTAPARIAQLDLPAEPTSVAVSGGLVAVAVPAPGSLSLPAVVLAGLRATEDFA